MLGYFPQKTLNKRKYTDTLWIETPLNINKIQLSPLELSDRRVFHA